MSEEEKKMIRVIVGNMKQMNMKSLTLMQNGSELLKARDAMDQQDEDMKKVG